jgi:hypothetical protein
MVTQGTSYDYRIKACAVDPTPGTSIFCSGYSILLGISVFTPEVSAPTNFIRVINNNNPSSVVYLTWQDNSNNENKFQIGRKLSGEPSSSYIVISEPALNTTSYLDNLVIPINTYDYYIKACLYAGSGSFICSDPVELLGVLVENIPTTISPPTLLSLSFPLTINSTNISLTWVDNSNNETKFIIEKKLSTATTYPQSDFFVLENIVTYIDNYVTHGVSYDYRVKACSSGISGGIICSDYSNELTSVMIPIETIVTVSAPTNLALSSTLNSLSTSIPLTWVNHSDNETKFIIEKKLSTAASYSGTIGYTLQNINHFTDLNVVAGTSYDYRVQACKENTAPGATNICSGYAQLLGVIIPKPIIEINSKAEEIPIVPVKTIVENVVPIISSTIKQISKKPTPVIPIKEASVKINDISLAFSDIKISVNKAKKEFINLINEKVLDIINRNEKSKKKIDSIKLYSYRDELINKINSSLLNLATITSLDVNNFKMEVVNGIEDIKIIAGESEIISKKDSLDSENIIKIISELFRVVIDKSKITTEQGGDLFYKDTNNDGVSDYDSIYIYNIDPIAPSVTSTYEGRNIVASDKILLGFNTASTKLVKVVKEEPPKSAASVVSTYKVKEVKLTEKKEILIGGQALPNSFITLYIYSTPIMVTVKTDNNGEWQYLLDKELENGDHTIYTASVNNTGNIVAKSSGYLFTKTAEAITFQDIPVVEAAVNIEKPGLLDGINLYLILAAFVAVIIIVLVLTGVISKKNV